MSLHSEGQYKHRFSGLKNVTVEGWAYIEEQCQRREAFGKQTEVYLDNRQLPSKRVALGRRRIRKSGSKSRIPRPASNSK